jgi:hypothetical protein
MSGHLEDRNIGMGETGILKYWKGGTMGAKESAVPVGSFEFSVSIIQYSIIPIFHARSL